MKTLTWPDNDCTVGWTCFHAFLNEADKAAIKELCPAVTFTPTFHPHRTWERPEVELPYYIGVRKADMTPLLLMLSLECGRMPVCGEKTGWPSYAAA